MLGKTDLQILKIDPIQNRLREPKIVSEVSYRTFERERETWSPGSLAGGEVNSGAAVSSTSWVISPSRVGRNRRPEFPKMLVSLAILFCHN